MTISFELGVVGVTPGAVEAAAAAGAALVPLLLRHMLGDWGDDIDPADAAANDRAVGDGGRLLSCYRVGAWASVWIVHRG